MSLINTTNQTIALAGIAQACALVHQLATTGKAEPCAFESSIGSVLKIDADSVPDVYGNVQGVKLGLQELDRQLGGKLLNSPEQTRYAAQLVYLQKQLSRRADMLKSIQTGIARAQAQAEQYGVLHPNVLANLADIYHGTISTLQPRIMVVGDQQFLSNQSTVNRIRALLLAGIRASLLWRQCGGSRWKLLIFRSKLQDEARYLLTQV
ncbi:MAG: high frequency lysogenization protein HflD [Methylococcales bacterium]|nr:high frequency lysogenization protein HflD [Methylococcales bacterium]